MSGHSKWANIKRQKAKVDAQKGRIFSRMAREIMVAARQGGGNPEANFRLKIAIERARASNLPMENIQRAIAKATGSVEGANYEEITYEGYGPHGVAIMLDLLTDNRNRTAGEIRYLFDRHGGSLGASGSVAWMFKKSGLLMVEAPVKGMSEDEVMLAALDAGAEDFKAGEDGYEILTAPEDLQKVKEALEATGIKVADADITMLPKNTVELSGEAAEQAMKLLDLLEEHDDVQRVYTNLEVQDA